MNAPPDLNRLASLYPWMEAFTFGPWLTRCRVAFLHEMRHCRRALVLGDGDGRFTARLLRTNQEVEVDAVDASTAMLRALIRRAGPHADRVHAHCADVRLWQPANPPYDLVVTHFFLDCLTNDEVLALAKKLHGALSPSALWVISEFVIPREGFGRLVARPVVSGLYVGFRWLTGLVVRELPDHPAVLQRSGFALQSRRTMLAGLLAGEIWSLGDIALPVMSQ